MLTTTLDRKCFNADGTRKRRFVTMEQARENAARLAERARKGYEPSAYKCPSCEFYHVGHLFTWSAAEHVTRAELAEMQIPRCAGIARNQTRSRPWDRDEAESVAVAAVDEALRTFEPKRGKGSYRARWRRHADKTCGDRVRDYLRSVKRRPTVPLTDHAAESAASPATLDPDREPRVGWYIEYEDWVLALSRQLSPRHGETLRGRYLHADGSTGEGLALRLGVQVGRAAQLHQEALAVLRERYRDATSWRELVDAIRSTARNAG